MTACAEEQAVRLDLLVGSYNRRATGGPMSAGVHRVRVDPADLSTAEVCPWAKVRDPSWLTFGPSAMGVIAAEELPAAENPRLLHLGPEGSVEVLAFLPGSLTCHLVAHPTEPFIATAQYGDGSVALIDLRTGRCHVARLEGRGPVRERQDGPHAHFVQFLDAGRTLVVLDLGSDALHLLDVVEGTLRSRARLPFPAGCGPRHLAASADGCRLYVATELDDGVQVVERDAELLELGLAIHPFGLAEPGGGALSAVRLSSDGRFLYVAGRRQGDVAVLAVDTGGGGPRLIERVPTGGQWPRDAAFDPTGRWLIVANERSDCLTVFERDHGTGRLERIPGAIAVPKPASVLFAIGGG